MALKFCVGFCYTTTQISHSDTHTPSVLSLSPLRPSNPSRSSKSTGLGCLLNVATSQQLSISHMIVCSCLSIRPALFSPLSPQVCSLYLRLHSFPENSFINTVFSHSICIRYLLFSFRLTSLYITGSRFIHLSRTDSNLFFFMLSNSPLHICTTSSLSIHL